MIRNNDSKWIKRLITVWVTLIIVKVALELLFFFGWIDFPQWYLYL